MDGDFEKWLFINLGLTSEWTIDKVDFNLHPMTITVFISYCGNYECPVCRTRSPKYDKRVREWREIDYGNSICLIKATIPRVNCPFHGVHEVDTPWAGKASKLTYRFESKCLDYSVRMAPHLACDLLKIKDTTLWNIIHYYSDHSMRNLDLSRMDSFCMDETSSTKGHHYITTFIDPSCGRVAMATLGKESSTVTEFKIWLIHHGGDPDKIRNVCCDMSPAFISGIRSEFPKAKIIFDRYHVINAAVVMVDNVRRISGLKGKKAKGLRFGFTSNREDLQDYEPEYRSRVESILSEYASLGEAYAVKECIRDFYEITDKAFARLFLFELIDRCIRSEIEEIFDFGLLLDEHFEGILNWQEFRKTNGIAEGINSVNQALKCTSRGFRNPENFISMIYLRSRFKPSQT